LPTMRAALRGGFEKLAFTCLFRIIATQTRDMLGQAWTGPVIDEDLALISALPESHHQLLDVAMLMAIS
jgi:hypothetical protein